MSILDKPQTIAIALGRSLQSVRRFVRSGLTSLTGFSGFVPDYVTVAPRDLRTADPMMAEEFYQGRYVLRGRLVETGGASPFLQSDADIAWKEDLHSFGWLRHLSSKGDPLSATHARAYIRDWLEINSNNDYDLVWKHTVVSRRLIFWLCHSDMIMNGAEHEFHKSFMRSIAVHVRYLKRYASTFPDGRPRLLAYLALSYASVCNHGQQNSLQFARDRLARELAQQVLPDGGHVSRNPEAIVDILAFLLPLRQACVTVGLEPPGELTAAIERMLPALRFFRLGDGNLARFNGVGLVASDLIATLLRYDETNGEPLSYASYSGYQRLALNDTIVLTDVGEAPRGELSTKAHAGCLSFEFSSGMDCLVVNCGVPSFVDPEQSAVWRTSAAHSTAVFRETSSCRFENFGAGRIHPYGQLLASNLRIETSREDTADSLALVSSHLGYAREFGVRHQRSLILEEAGIRLRGSDWFSAPDKSDLLHMAKDDAVIHFHLHPTARVIKDPEHKNACIIETRGQQRWQFSCDEVMPSIEESIFFASVSGSNVRTWQIALKFNAQAHPELNWTFLRIA